MLPFISISCPRSETLSASVRDHDLPSGKASREELPALLVSWVPFSAPGPEVPGVRGHLVPSNHLHLPPASHLSHSSHCSKHSQRMNKFPVTHPLPPQLLVPIAIWGGKQLSPQPSQGATSSHSTPGSCSCIDLFSPAMLRACLTSHLSCLPFRVTQSSREPVCVPTPAELPR